MATLAGRSGRPLRARGHRRPVRVFRSAPRDRPGALEPARGDVDRHALRGPRLARAAPRALLLGGDPAPTGVRRTRRSTPRTGRSSTGCATFRSDQLVEHDRPPHQSMRERCARVLHAAGDGELASVRPQGRGRAAGRGGARGRMDVLEALAAPLPVRVITQMMGVPEEDREHLRHLADRLLYINRGEPDRHAAPDGGHRRDDRVRRPEGGRARRRRRPTTSSRCSRQAEKEGVFTRHQVLVNTALLLFAGHETTMNLICNGTLALVRNPDQWERLRADPEGAARLATEECLRYDPPVKSTQRIAARGRRAPRQDDPQGRPDPLDHGRRQPRSARVRGARPLRHPPAAEHARLLRRRDPLLPRRLARPHRGPGGLPGAGRAVRVAPARDRGARRTSRASSSVR